MNEDIPFQFWLARWFGSLIISTDFGCTITGYAWRGNLYVVSESVAPVDAPLLPGTP